MTLPKRRKLSRRRFLLGSMATSVGAAIASQADRAEAFFNMGAFLKKPNNGSGHAYFSRIATDQTISINGTQSIAINASGERFVSTFVSDGVAGASPFVIGLNTNGISKWQKHYKSSSNGNYSNSAGMTCCTDSDGNLFVLGDTFSSGTISLFLIKYDSSSNVLWQKGFGFANSTTSYPRSLSSDGTNVYFFFGYNSNNYVMKVDSTGAIVWQFSFGTMTTLGYSDRPISVDSSGNLYLSGSYTSAPYNTNNAFHLTKFNSSGTKLWSQLIDPAQSNAIYGCAPDSFGNSYVFGAIGATQYGFVAKYDPSGNIQWQKKIGNGAASIYFTVGATDSSGNVYLAGRITDAALNPNSQNILCKLDPSGSIQWMRAIYGLGFSSCNQILHDTTGNIHVLMWALLTPVVIKLPDSGAFNGSSTGWGGIGSGSVNYPISTTSFVTANPTFTPAASSWAFSNSSLSPTSVSYMIDTVQW